MRYRAALHPALVVPTGFEPVTSALSKQRSKPTELRDRKCSPQFGAAANVGEAVNPDNALLNLADQLTKPAFAQQVVSEYDTVYRPIRLHRDCCIRMFPTIAEHPWQLGIKGGVGSHHRP